MARNKTQIENIEQPPVNDPGRKDRRPPEAKDRSRTARGNGGGVNDEEQGEDRRYSVASRDRWPDNSGTALHAEERAARLGKTSEGGEEEEEEEQGGAALTKAQLAAALDEAKVEYPAGANKAALVELYDKHIKQ